MSTRAQIAIQTGPEAWAHVYVHCDGYPAHMLPALARWMPEDILAAREIRQVQKEALNVFDPPRPPVMHPRPTPEFEYLYLWQDGAWVVQSEQSRRD
jgi:hypothetical protein